VLAVPSLDSASYARAHGFASGRGRRQCSKGLTAIANDRCLALHASDSDVVNRQIQGTVFFAGVDPGTEFNYVSRDQDENSRLNS
jgi:hypothetical protein